MAPFAKAHAYAAAAVLSGVAWSLLLYVAGAHSLATTSLGACVLLGGGTGVAISYLFRGTFQRARLPWVLFLPLATVPLGMSVFAALLWVTQLRDGYPLGTRYLEILSDSTTGFLFLFPIVYLLSFINQWVLQLVLVGWRVQEPLAMPAVAGERDGSSRRTRG